MKSEWGRYLSLGVLLVLSLAVVADEIAMPKGIRIYDRGVAPQFILSDMDGETFDLADSRGHWVFVHFWASWCGPCREEMPAIQRLAESLPEGGLEIVMINTAEDEDTIFSFMSVYAPEMVTLMDSDGLVTEQWKPRGLPATYLVDPDGRLRYQAIGGRPWDQGAYQEFLKRLAD